MIEAPHYTAAGSRRDAPFALPADYFDGTVNEPVMHQAVKVFLNNQRQGTHATKTRSFVSGGNQKPWKQKGTGRARQGSTRAPHWRGGGIVFGPHPRDYTTLIPRKVRQLARKSALNARAREGALHVVEQFSFASPKTSRLVELLRALGVEGRKALVLTAAAGNSNVFLSGRNIPHVRVLPYTEASAYDILWSDVVIVEEGGFTGVVPEPTTEAGEVEIAGASAKPKRKAAAKAEVAEAKPTRKKATKSAAKAEAPAEKPAKKATKSAAKKAAPKAAAKKAAPKKKKGDE